MKNAVWWYGLSLGMLLLILQALHYQTFIHNLRIELFGAIIGIIFLAVGIYLGIGFHKKRTPWTKTGKTTPISDRELEVLFLMAEGYSNQEIADKLFVSLNTIKTHISSIYLKLHAKRRTQAVQKAMELGLIASSERMK